MDVDGGDDEPVELLRWRWEEIVEVSVGPAGFGRVGLSVFPKGAPWDVPGPNSATGVGVRTGCGCSTSEAGRCNGVLPSADPLSVNTGVPDAPGTGQWSP